MSDRITERLRIVSDGRIWHVLQRIYNEHGDLAITAATAEDGIGVIATWRRKAVEEPWALVGWGTDEDYNADADATMSDTPLGDTPPWLKAAAAADACEQEAPSDV